MIAPGPNIHRWRPYLALYGAGPPYPAQVYFAIPLGRMRDDTSAMHWQLPPQEDK